MVFTIGAIREVSERGRIRIGFVEKDCFQFECKICTDIARGAVTNHGSDNCHNSGMSASSGVKQEFM